MEESNTIISCVLFQRPYGLNTIFIHHVQHTPSRSGWHVMVKHRDGCIWSMYHAASDSQTSEGLRGSHLVHKVSINIQNGGFSGGIANDVSIPDFLKHCFWFSLLLLHMVILLWEYETLH